MEASKKEFIYNRLLEMRPKIENTLVPNPQHINSCIGECHLFIEEIERYYIETNQEMSVIQRALNDTVGAYETEKENLIVNDETIKALPSIKDREAMANSRLKDKIHEIHKHQTELMELNNLLRAINLKLKNINRLNSDIKLRVRIMESQIKLETPNASDVAAKSLIEALSEPPDVFKDAETKSRDTDIVDPTVGLDVDKILEPESNLVDPDNSEAGDEQRFQDPSDVLWENEPDETSVKEAEGSKPNQIDLDALITDSQPEKGETESNSSPIKADPEGKPEQKTIDAQSTTQKIDGPQNADQIDIDALLSQYETTRKA